MMTEEGARLAKAIADISLALDRLIDQSKIEDNQAYELKDLTRSARRQVLLAFYGSQEALDAAFDQAFDQAINEKKE